MHTTTGLRMIHHQVKIPQQERADVQGWLGRVKLAIKRAVADHKKKREIELILFEKGTVRSNSSADTDFTNLS